MNMPSRVVAGFLPVNYIQVERNIKMVPAWRNMLKVWEKFIEETSSPCLISEVRVQGGEQESIQERIMSRKEHSKEYQRLLRNCKIVDSALQGLNKQEQEFMRLFFWSDMKTDNYSHDIGVALRMGFSERTVWRWKDRMLCKMEPALRDIDPTVLIG